MRLRCCESAPWISAFLGVTRHGKHRAVYELLADKYNADIQKGWLGGIDLTPLLRSPAGSVKKLLKTTRRLDAWGGVGLATGRRVGRRSFSPPGTASVPHTDRRLWHGEKTFTKHSTTRRLDAD